MTVTAQQAAEAIARVLALFQPEHIKAFRYEIFNNEVSVRVSSSAFDAICHVKNLHASYTTQDGYQFWEAQLDGVSVTCIRKIETKAHPEIDALSGCLVLG